MNRVRVRISLTEKVRYSQTVEMSRETYEDLLKDLDGGGYLAGERVHAYLNPRDICDSEIDPDDVDEFEIVEELP